MFDNLDVTDETTFQRLIVEVARLHGWRAVHFPRSMSVNGRHLTAYAYDGKGWPDLVLVHDDLGILFREVKAESGRVSAEQTEWLRRLHNAGGDVGIWKPSDWQRILRELGAKGGRDEVSPTDPSPYPVPFDGRLRRRNARKGSIT